MKKQIRTKCKEIKPHMEKARAERRRWHQFRTELMRLQPEKVKSLLENQNTKLVEITVNKEPLGSTLADKFFSSANQRELREYQEALIYATVEMDAALKFADAQPVSGIDKNKLGNILKLWGVS